MSSPRRRSLRGRRSPNGGALAVCALLSVSIACATSGPLVYSPEELEREVAERLSDLPNVALLPASAPYGVSAPAIERARSAVAGLPPSERAAALGRALGDPELFGLRYQLVGTTTADETLKRGYGNCLSLASVYVGLARALGLRAFYLDARDPIIGPEVGDDLAVTTDHIAALVHTPDGYVSIDFDGQLERFRTLGAIGDLQAMARYYNNWGFELIEKANGRQVDIPWRTIRDHFAAATRLDPSFAGGWNNLGIAESRLGHWREARRSYRRATESDSGLSAPYNNLGKIELERGDLGEAIALFQQAMRRQRHSPHVRYNLALAQHRVGDDKAALETLRQLLEMNADSKSARSLLENIESKTQGAASTDR